ncbi:unnamed protein product [Cuscuta campestris]|uniref:Uncharacterized protein n=1 Tax=Cuscuta campestris TaxID=132261 RepID=A0A484KRS3_9ASTE|nr:unnamed protein product [Cuscuta campestris]
MCLNDALYGALRSNLLAQEIIPPVGRIYNILVQDETTRNGMHKGESSEASASVFAVKNKMEVKELVCSHCGKTGHEVEGGYKLIGYPEGWVFRDQAGRGNGRGKGRGTARDGGRSTAVAGRSTVTGGRGEAHAVQREEKGPSLLPNFEDLTPKQWNAVHHSLSLSPIDNSPKLSGEILNEDGSSSSTSVDHFDDDDEVPAEDQSDRPTWNGRPEEGDNAAELQAVDLVDRSDCHQGRKMSPWEINQRSTLWTVLRDTVDRLRGRETESRAMKKRSTVMRTTVDRPQGRKGGSEEPSQTVDPVDRSTDGGRPSSSQQATETLGRGQQERRPNFSCFGLFLGMHKKGGSGSFAVDYEFGARTKGTEEYVGKYKRNYKCNGGKAVGYKNLFGEQWSAFVA